jgi:hypothetical protein
MALSKTNQFLARPITGAIVTILILLAGLVGSIYTQEARASLSLWLPSLGTYGFPVVILGCAALALLFFLRERALDVLRAHSQFRLETATETLESIVRTQPPVEFQTSLGVYFEKALVACQQAQGSEEIKGSIALIVEGLAELARIFDHGPANGKYAANVMVFYAPDEGEEWFKHVSFLEDGVGLQNLRGLLALCTEFSAQKAGDAPCASPDPTMRPFALPVPKNPGGAKDNQGHGWRMLPGAPRVYLHKCTEHFCPTTELSKWCAEHGDFNQYVISQVNGYFQGTELIRGFCSMPLFVPSPKLQQHSERDVIAVLNVHWSEARLLEKHHSAKSFAEAIFPLRALLAGQLSKLFAQSGKPQPLVGTAQ